MDCILSKAPERRSAMPALALSLSITAGFLLAGSTALGDDGHHRHGARFCSTTAWLQLAACRHEVWDDLYAGKAICINRSDEEEREECSDELREDTGDAQEECREQFAARRDLCDGLGEARYDPDFDPEHFQDDFANPNPGNPYFPLGIGSFRKYVGGDETTMVTVLDKTKNIEGVTCIVVNDLVSVAGVPLEDTNDWFALRKDGTVDYCGEQVQDFEVFEGDDPQDPELTAIDGSFKEGRDGDRSGTLFPVSPEVGDVYRQEWSAGNAEDAAMVLSTTYGFGADPELDELVPQALAELLCADDDCVVTADFSPLEPEAFERKYYARGIGPFLEVDVTSGEISQLVDCNHDPRCAVLPAP